MTQPAPTSASPARAPRPASRLKSRLTRVVGTAMVPALFFAVDANSQVPVEDEVVTTGRYLAFDRLNALRAPTPVIDVPQSLTLLTEDQIEGQAFTDFGDVLRYTPGLSISQGEGHRDAIIIRGQQTTADFFVDGVRDDVQYFRPLYNVEQIEILRGANALVFGRGGAGGIVNRVTKAPVIGESFNGLTASVDTFGSVLGSADSNYQLGEQAALRLNVFGEELGNHRDAFDGKRFGINPTLAAQLTPATRLDLSYEYLDDDRVVDRGVPSVVVEGGPNTPLEDFDSTFFGSRDANSTILQAHQLRARVDHEFSANLHGNVTAQYADYDKAYQNLYPSEAVSLLDGRISEIELDGYLDTTTRQNLILQGNLAAEFATGPVSHTLILGAEYADQDTENARLDNVFQINGDDQLSFAFSDPLVIPAFGFNARARDRASEVEVLSGFVQDQIDVTDGFQLVLGARYDRFDIAVDDLVADARFERTDEKWTPRLGAIFKPAQNISLYASYSESFLPRSGDQFLTLNLDSASTRPQGFENREVGLKWDFADGLSFTTAVFRLDRESFTSLDPEDQEQLIAVDGSRVDGFEAQLTGEITPAWFVSAGYSYLDGRVEDLSVADGAVVAGGLDGNRTRQTPEHMASLWNRYQVNDRFGLGLGATYQDSFFVREDNSTQVPDFIRVDAAAYYDLNDAVRLQLNVENLLDTDYFPDAHSNTNISTGAPINVRFSVMSRF